MGFYTLLPTELLDNILRYLDDDPQCRGPNLAACAQVSKQWHRSATAILYRNIAVTERSLHRFAKFFNAVHYGHLVRSLTLRIFQENQHFARLPRSRDTASDGESSASDAGSLTGAENDVDVNVEPAPLEFPNMALLVAQLPNLSSFSLHTSTQYYSPFPGSETMRDDYYRQNFANWIDFDANPLHLLLDALPESCVSLELDLGTCAQMVAAHLGTLKRQHLNQPWWKHHGLCHSLHGLLPRLRHCRLRLWNMCSDIFIIKHRHICSFLHPRRFQRCTDSNWCPGSRPASIASLANIETLDIVANMDDHRVGFRCGTAKGSRSSDRSDGTWSSIVPALLGLLHNAELRPISPTVRVTVSTVSAFERDPGWKTMICTDLMSKVSTAVPYRWTSPDPLKDGIWVARTLDGTDLITRGRGRGLGQLLEVVQGHTWRDMATGARLPASVVHAAARGAPSYASGLAEAVSGLITAQSILEAWELKEQREARRGQPHSPVKLWEWEARTGVKMLHAEARIGENRYLNLEPVEIVAPEGWVLEWTTDDTQELYREDDH